MTRKDQQLDCIPQRKNCYKEISMCHINIQSLGHGEQGPTTSANVKLDQIRTILCLQEKFDIIGISETWLTDRVPDEDIELENYKLYRKDRAGRAGGVCLYITSSLPCERKYNLEDNSLELVWIEIKLIPKSILVGVCYRPPNMTRQQANDFIENMQISLNKAMCHGADSIYLLGDFNDRCTDWAGKHPDSELKENLKDMTMSFGLQQLINEPTYMTKTSANLLDLIFTDSPGYIKKSGTLPPIATSKHAVVYCICKKTHVHEKPYTKEIWKYDEADIPGLNIAIGDFPFDDVLGECEDINHAAELWTHIVLQIAKEYIPHHTIKISPHDKPWITKDIKTVIRTRDRLYRRYQRTKRDDHYEVYERVKLEVNSKIQSAKQTHKSKLIKKLEDLKNSPKGFWSVAKQVYGNKTRSSIPTLSDQGKQYCTAEEKANLLAEYFASQSQRPNLPPGHTLPPREEKSYLTDIIITVEETMGVIRKLQMDKAPGPDDISNRLLKLTGRSLAPSLTMLLNKMLQTSSFPRIWKQANVTPIYKKGDAQDKKNYRPVSLLSSVGKIFERLIFNKIYTVLESRGLLTWRNSGYRKKDSTANQLIYIVNNIYKSLDNQEECAMVFLDQSKAFDRIYHEGLKVKLKSMGINGPLFDLICNYLDERKLRVAVDGSKSRWFKTTAGVPQGSILGPLLFLIYINDIVEDLECEIYLYADDAVLTTSFNMNDTEQSFERLNRDLEKLSTWAETWFMSFNPTKTKYMVVSNKHQFAYPDICLNNTVL